MNDDLVKRLQNPPFGTETSERLLMKSAAARIEALEAALAKADALAESVHMMIDRSVIWRNETEREFQTPLKTYEDAHEALAYYREARKATT